MLLVSPLILLTLLGGCTGRDEVYLTSAQFLALFPGKIGSYLRVAFYRFTTTSTHRECYIGFGSYFSKRDVSVAADVSIGAYCVIGRVDIGTGALVASKVSIPSGRHQHRDAKGRRLAQGEMAANRITIGCDSWVGESALILADVGEGCVVGGGSVVTKPVPDNVTVAGNPARPIGTAKD